MAGYLRTYFDTKDSRNDMLDLLKLADKSEIEFRHCRLQSLCSERLMKLEGGSISWLVYFALRRSGTSFLKALKEELVDVKDDAVEN